MNSAAEVTVEEKLVTVDRDNHFIYALIVLVLTSVAIVLPVHVIAAAELVIGWPKISAWSILLSYGLTLPVVLAAARAMMPRKFGSRVNLFETSPRIILAAFGVIAACYLLFAAEVLFSFPSGVDAVAYHLPKALSWLDAGSMKLPPNSGWRAALPGNGEIGSMVVLLTGFQSAVIIPNVLVLLTALISLYLLARRLSHDPAAALTSAALFSTVPMVLFQFATTYVDLYGTAYLLAGGVLSTTRSIKRWHLALLSGCSMGLAVGSKPIFCLYVGLTLSAVVWHQWHTTGNRRGVIRHEALIICGILLCSGFWFYRSYQKTGNPFFPLAVKIGSMQLPGFAAEQITPWNYQFQWLRSEEELLLYPWTEWAASHGYNFDQSRGLGPAFATFVPLGVLFSLCALFRRHTTYRRRVIGILLILLLLGGGLWVFSMMRVLRFGLPLVALACVLTTPMFAFLLKHARIGTGLLILATFTTGSVLAIAVPVARTISRVRHGEWSRSQFYGYPPVIDTLPAGSKILSRSNESIEFLLVGSRTSNQIVHEYPVSIDAAFLHDRKIAYVITTGEWTLDDKILTGMRAQLIHRGSVRTYSRYVSREWRIWDVGTKSK